MAAVATRLVPKELMRALRSLTRDAALGASLTDLMPLVEVRVPKRGAFVQSEYKFETLRFARLVLLAEVI